MSQGSPMSSGSAPVAGPCGRRTGTIPSANCSAPREVGEALAVAARVTGLPGVGYPNRGETWDAEARQWRGDGGFDVATVAGWAGEPSGGEPGAAFVGGCCQVGPGDIADLRTALAG